MDEIKDANWTTVTPPKPEAEKAPEQDISQYLAAPHEVRVLERAGRFILYIPELGLTARGKDLAAAHAELSQARERRLREFAAEGILGWLPSPGAAAPATAQGKSLLSQLKVFLIKAAVVTLMFLGAVNVLGQALGDVGYRLEKKLDAAINMTPEQVEGNRARAEKIAEKLAPIVREVLVMFREQPRPAPPAAPPTLVPAEPPVQENAAKP